MSAHVSHDLRASMAAAKSQPAVRCILTTAANRLGDIERIGWPALEDSLRRELADLTAMAKAKGFGTIPRAAARRKTARGQE